MTASPSRRSVLRTGMLGGGAALAYLVSRRQAPARAATVNTVVTAPQPARGYAFNQGWLFGGQYAEGAADPGYDDSGFAQVTLPHTVIPLSWGNWDNTGWENVWIYRKHLTSAELGATSDASDASDASGRVFVDFDGVMTNATVIINGTVLGTHQGGYLPFSAELTGHLTGGDNVLAVIVDARWLAVPPGGAAGGAITVDYLQPGGIYRDVALRVVPDIFLADVFARPDNVLSANRSVIVQATIDAVLPSQVTTTSQTSQTSQTAQISTELLDGARKIAATSTSATIAATGTQVVTLILPQIGEVTYWSPQTPKLYTVRTSLTYPGGTHTVSTRIGFRDARFELDGFYLNGERFEIFGLNRHQLFPYTGMAAPARLQRRDAEILKYELNCNMVRCSHYPQSPHFLDACDELGLMVWEEPPGWGYVGDQAWQEIVVQNVNDMVVRDRNRPSVIVWATRLNETANYPALYAQTRQVAYDLDGTRPTTGAVTFHDTAGWAEDVFSYDDYHSSNGSAALLPPVPGVPYFVSESVGALDGSPTYRWIDTGATLAIQALMHAQAHGIAQSQAGYAGLLGWAGIDYASYNGGDRIWQTLKTPGVIDTFRVPKPGAAFYQSQVDPSVRPVILPVFFWDFGPGSPPDGPGPGSMIATNLDRLEIYAGGQHLATGTPDTQDFGALAHPPVFTDLTVSGAGLPELRIDGYLGDRKVATVRMAADPSGDQLALTADHTSIEADGSDATRITFRAVDAYGNQRPDTTGEVALSVTGPAVLVGDNPFPFGTYGGVGGAFVRSIPDRTGLVRVTAEHPDLGRASVRILVI
ncbi:MAG: beta-galactosidase [Streptosporangiaceae bacterium]|nr:beta-galactosidase [Streptosporangiaceae bacterium]